MIGVVKFFSNEKGFGFITVEGQKDVFVHFTGIRKIGNNRRTLKDGAKVEFEIIQDAKGEKANDVVEI